MAWVLKELANTLRNRKFLDGFVEVLRELKSDPTAVVIEPNQKLFDHGTKLYADGPDKDWSPTDCISFVVMQNRGITVAPTGDHHFERAGFRALSK